jgi:predicted negative regulator of RcsB-dependent stress response
VEDLSEKEQLEAMRAWWKENGRYVISGIVLGVVILGSWNRWQAHQESTGLEASVLYETLAGEVDDGDLEDAETAAANIYDNYSSTTYASLARLAMAKLYMENGRDQDAADTLNELLASHSRSDMPLIGPLQAFLGVADLSDLQMVGRLRLAKIYLYQDKQDEAIELLSGSEDSAFSARYSEILGDAHAALGQVTEATAAYERAMLDDVGAPTVDRALVRMKIVDLPDDAPVEEPETDQAATDEDAADPVDEK